MDLFGETKHLLMANVSSMGNGTVRMYLTLVRNPFVIEVFIWSHEVYIYFQTKEAERCWFAFILYSIKRLTQKNEESEKDEIENTGLTLCRILRTSKLKYFSDLYLVLEFVVWFLLTVMFILYWTTLQIFSKNFLSLLSRLYWLVWESRLYFCQVNCDYILLNT
jgi:hypothetical protein